VPCCEVALPERAFRGGFHRDVPHAGTGRVLPRTTSALVVDAVDRARPGASARDSRPTPDTRATRPVPVSGGAGGRLGAAPPGDRWRPCRRQVQVSTIRCRRRSGRAVHRAPPSHRSHPHTGCPPRRRKPAAPARRPRAVVVRSREQPAIDGDRQLGAGTGSPPGSSTSGRKGTCTGKDGAACVVLLDSRSRQPPVEHRRVVPAVATLLPTSPRPAVQAERQSRPDRVVAQSVDPVVASPVPWVWGMDSVRLESAFEVAAELTQERRGSGCVPRSREQDAAESVAFGRPGPVDGGDG